jgi:protein-L-isoaspartate(D-aspartate) O-methyltransferase
LKDFKNFEQQRINMVEDQIRRRGISDERVLNAMLTIPRHLFVKKNEQQLAYFDGPLPIGNGQTISQPYIVAFMTDELKLKSHHKVLEIGTGCGYQSAVLSTLCNKVISLECIKGLANSAKIRLDRLGYKNITIHNSNGLNGWQDGAPYNRIIGTAAATSIPEALIDQLAPDGRMILPVGGSVFDQSLFIIKKNKKGKVSIKRSLGVRFVPMIDI